MRPSSAANIGVKHSLSARLKAGIDDCRSALLIVRFPLYLERIVADIDAYGEDGAIDLFDMAVPRLTLAPFHHHPPVGQEHVRTIP
jgi:hypothetical protein